LTLKSSNYQSKGIEKAREGRRRSPRFARDDRHWVVIARNGVMWRSLPFSRAFLVNNGYSAVFFEKYLILKDFQSKLLYNKINNGFD
jgi:hypothetical protein